jgi:hypothetical protein
LAAERARLEAIAKEQAEKEKTLREEESRLANLKSKEEVIKPLCLPREAPIYTAPKEIQAEDQAKLKSKDKITEWHDNVISWEGFDAAIELVLNILNNALLKEQKEIIINEILDEVKIYKKNG